MPAEQQREDFTSPLLEKCAASAAAARQQQEKTADKQQVGQQQSEAEEKKKKESSAQDENMERQQQKDDDKCRQRERLSKQQQQWKCGGGAMEEATASAAAKRIQQGTEKAADLQEEHQRRKQEADRAAAESKRLEQKKEKHGGTSKQEPRSVLAEEEDADKEDTKEEKEEGPEEGGTAAGGAKKKKKKKKKTAKAAATPGHDGDASAASSSAAQDATAAAATSTAGGQVLAGAAAEAAAAAAARENSKLLRKLGTWQGLPAGQTWPPTKSIRSLYTRDTLPAGEVKQLLTTKKRTAAAEQRESMRLQEVDIHAIREAAECHRQVRRYVQGLAKPGIPLITLCEKLEAKSRELLGCSSFGRSSSSSRSSSGESSLLERGWGFPTGCSLNNCAAHYTPNPGDKRVLTADDICKLDFGVQVKGRIIDCAFSIAFDEAFDPLIQATQDGTNTGLAHAGVDARLSEIGGYIQEAIESYEMEIEGKKHPIKAIRNLTGHSIDLYKIHAGKSVPIVKPSSCGTISSAPLNRMEEGEVYAIECFASTGRAVVLEEGECSHYMKNSDVGFAPLRLKSAKDLLKVIEEYFGTLAFCRRWLEDLGCTHHLLALKDLVEKQIITPYPPLSDIKKSFTSQMEHTVFIGSHAVEVVSRGDDF